MKKFLLGLLLLLALAIIYFQQFPGGIQGLQLDEPIRYITIEPERAQIISTNSTPMFAPSIRWGEMPVRVWLDERSGEGRNYWNDETASTIKSAFSEWETASRGLLRFEFVPDREDAQITVNFTSTNLSISGQGDAEKLGYGGPSWRPLGKFNLIEKGFVIIVLQQMPCITKDTAMHEIGHALGFQHSDRPGSAMYMYATCSQIIDAPIVDSLQELYSTPALPDLEITGSEIRVSQMYFNVNINVTNSGLSTGDNVTVAFFDDADGKELYRKNWAPLQPGYYLTLQYANIRRPASGILRITVDPENRVNELSEDNNSIVVNLK